MFQTKSGKQPPATMRSAIAAVARTHLEAVAMDAANMGVMPRGLNATDAQTVANMARAIRAARTSTTRN